MRLIEKSVSTSIIETLNEGLVQDKADECNMTFNDYVDKDFNLFLEDNNISKDNVTEKDVNDYFTGMFYDIEDENDIDESNEAEKYIREKYLGEQSNLEESVKDKSKEENRILMKQGNVTCVKEGNKYKVFEDKDSNLLEYDNEEEAMKDTLGRCGVDVNNELKKPVNESTVSDEDKSNDSFIKDIDFLIDDEHEAIDGYESKGKDLKDKLDEESYKKVEETFNHIINEEKEHIEMLTKLKSKNS